MMQIFKSLNQANHGSDSHTVVLIFNSFICASAMVDGVSIITSRPELFLGNAITSRMESSPAKIEHNLSNPKARPPCGGAPYSKASIKKPNCFCASSGENPKCLNMSDCRALS